MALEIELKLRFPAEYVAHIKQLSLLTAFSIAAPISQRLRSTYYDTPERVLGKNRIAFRIRQIGDHWVQTIKSGGTIAGGLHQHHECECPIAENQPDFEKIADQRLKQYFSDKHLRASLKPIFITDFHRTTYLLEPSKDFRLEFCLDEGRIIADKKSVPINEIELELKSGETDQLLQFSEMLQAHCSFPLTPENMNKAKKGYALLTSST